MKTILPCILFMLLSGCGQSDKKEPVKLIASTCESRGCTGSEGCSACKNCSGCKHCAKEGGTCGVCAPAPAPKVKKVKKVK